MSQSARAELVVIGISGRALAQSAARAGWRVRVLDAFADRDTRAVAQAECIAREDAIALDANRMFAALSGNSERIIVVGSGFERSPHWLTRLAKYGMLCANDAHVVGALKDPDVAGELLQAIGFNVPQTQRMPPADARDWLQKEIGGAGGLHVRPAAGAVHRANRFYQRRVPGEPMSVTFLSDAQRAWILGFNLQTIEAIGSAPYCYVGASTCIVEAALSNRMQAQLDRLVQVTGLRGLNGLDFMLDAGQVYALEVNPRPTATFELYEPEVANGLAHWHVRSFQQHISELEPPLCKRASAARAYRIVFAKRALRVPEALECAEGCRDLPGAGTLIPAGAPVLSVFAEGEDDDAARAALAQRVLQVERDLVRWEIEPSPSHRSGATTP